MDFYRDFGLGSACTNGFGGNDLLKFAELRTRLFTKIWVRPKQIEHGPLCALFAPPLRPLCALRPQAHMGLPPWAIGCAMHDVPQAQGPAEITRPR